MPLAVEDSPACHGRNCPGGVPAGLPLAVLAAAVLTAEGVSLLLVGSAALWLRGEPVNVGDVDAVVEPGMDNLRRLHSALAGLALRPRNVPQPSRPASPSCRSSRSRRPTAGLTACWNEAAGTGTGSARAPVRRRSLT